MRESGRSEAQDAFILGDALARQGDFESARGAFQTAIASEHPTHAANAWFNLGTLHQQRGETSLAVVAYQRAIAFDHAEFSPKAAVNLGYLLFNQLGQVQEAEEAFQVAIASPNEEQAQLARQNLAAMRQLVMANQRGDRHDVVDDSVDLSVGRGKGGLKWRRWVRRDRP